MTEPKRVQRLRAKGWRAPKGAVYVGRGSKWGNPYKVEKFRDGLGEDAYKVYEPEIDRMHTFFGDSFGDRHEARNLAAKRATQFFRDYTLPLIDLSTILDALAGRDLMCWCPSDQPCHADVLLEIAN